MSGIMIVELLNEKNYDTWKIQMEAVLVKNNLWGYVDGTIVKPEMGKKEITEWIKKDARARADIVLSIGTSELNGIHGINTSKEVWLEIQSKFQLKNPAQKVSLLKKIILTKLKEGENLRTHIMEFFEAETQLREIGLLINKEVLVILLLYSLPESFENFRCSMETCDELPDPDILKVKILEEQQLRKITENN